MIGSHRERRESSLDDFCIVIGLATTGVSFMNLSSRWRCTSFQHKKIKLYIYINDIKCVYSWLILQSDKTKPIFTEICWWSKCFVLFRFFLTNKKFLSEFCMNSTLLNMFFINSSCSFCS